MLHFSVQADYSENANVNIFLIPLHLKVKYVKKYNLKSFQVSKGLSIQQIPTFIF